MRITRLLCVLAVLVPSVARAEVVKLAELEERAVQSAPQLAVEQARVQGASADVAQAKSAYKPNVFAKADATYAPGRVLTKIDGTDLLVQGTRTLEEGSSAFAGQFRTGLDVGVSQHLYDFGRTRHAVAASQHAHQASADQRALVERDIRDTVRAAYFAWLLAHELLRITRDASEDAAQNRARVEGLVQQGEQSRNLLPRAKSTELLTTLELKSAESRVSAARADLERVVGAPMGDTAEPDLTLLQSQRAPARNGTDPAESLLAHQRAAAEAMVKVQESARWPVLDAALSVGIRKQVGNAPFPTYSTGVTLAIPLWDGGLTSAQIEKARAQLAEVEAQQKAQARDTRDGAARDERDLTQIEARIQVAEELLAICSQRVKESEESYGIGASDFEELGEAHAMLRRAQSELLLAQVERASLVVRSNGR